MPSTRRLAARLSGPITRLAVVFAVAAICGLPLARPALAADITLEARAALGGHVRPGAWAEVTVDVANDGPSLDGELRVRSQVQGRSQYGVAVSLPSGARQQHRLYAQTPLFGSKLVVELVVDGQAVATQDVPIRSHDVYSPVIGIVAERPEGFQRDVTAAAHNPNFNQSTVIALTPADLPWRVEAWAAIDRLIWQDVASEQLDRNQLAALRLWIGAGGRLVLLGGTTGAAALRAFPAELLPFQPLRTVDVPLEDLRAFLGSLPAEAAPAAALAGTLERGAVLGRTGDSVFAAQAAWGQGTVALVGLDPAEPWLARSDAAETLWRRLLPLSSGAPVNPLVLPDDSQFVFALQNLPAVALPPIEQLFLLLVAYIALIGPINYIVLRRLDRREWAWVTMPALVAIFAVVSYGMGATLKGSDVVINELAVVRSGQGTGEGLAQAYVGIFSPSRRTFDVRIPGGALLSNTVSQLSGGEQPLDVLFGDPSRLRNFEVGFGVLRGFRAEAPAAAPVIDANLSMTRGRISGTVTNRSPVDLEHVAVVFAGAVAVAPQLKAGESWTVDLQQTSSAFGFQLSEHIFGSSFPRDPGEQRTLYTRRQVIDQLSNYSPTIAGTPPDVPLLLGWHRAPALPVELADERANRIGDSLYITSLALALDAEALFTDQLIVKTVVETSGQEVWSDPSGYSLGRGTMTIELRPAALSGSFTVTSLELALTSGESRNLRGTGEQVEPLPDAEQPDQEDPLASATGGAAAVGAGQVGGSGGGGLGGAVGVVGERPPAGPDIAEPNPFEPWQPIPDIQLFDHGAGRWYEFPRFDAHRSYVIANPQRFVDDSGRVLVRLVNRSPLGDQKYFQLLARLEGTIE
ncbi:MAG: hypothetical protein M3N29_06340 [Chloroflexota bacterium]|nr:hypothetical protein [Chloroflexota bacterium]